MVESSNDGKVDGLPAGEGASERLSFSGRRSLRSPSEALQPDSAPPPPSGPSRKKRHPVIAAASGLLSFAGILAIALAVAWSLSLQKINAAGPLRADKAVTIAPGTDVSGIVDQLGDEGVIESRPLMTGALWVEGNRSKVKAGEYLFKQAASLRDVIDTLVSGKQILHSITIPEGLTSEQVVDRLRESDVLAGDINDIPKEGTLMPDTFKFARGTTREQIVRNMQSEQRKVLAEVWSHRSADLPVRSPYELVTLASIVEKETGKADERPRVAGVFINRLTRNMPLQSDPTIVYGLVGGKGTLGRGILRSELEQKTPYNTYTIVGLPPGPIANPGRAALEAVASPSRTKDLYFVADGTGGHVFADSLDQHRQNVAKWRQIEKDAKDKAGADVDKVPAVIPAAAGQRGDSGNLSIYGQLTGPSGSGSAKPVAPPSMAAFPLTASSSGSTSFGFKKPTTTASAATGPEDFDELDIEVDGVRSKASQNTGFEGDGPVGAPSVGADAGQAGSMATFPVSARQLADEKARALAYGLQPNSDHLPAAGTLQASNDGGPTRSNQMFGKGKIIDASEGTALDPLRDKTYDLTSVKTVPAIKALPPIPTMSSYAP